MTDTTVSHNLATNLRMLRELRALSQQQLADRAEVPRATLAHLESGSGNPTLLVLVRVASALNVTIEELVGPPRDTGRLYRRDELPVQVRSGVSIRQILPDRLPGIQVERLELPQGATMRGIPHTPGTREYLACELGQLQLTASGQTFVLEAGDVVVFRGDQRHGYQNAGDGPAVAWSVLLLAPAAG